MAGDWVKMEKATARKPEILRIACALNIHPDHAFGLCFRFWSWCDDHLTTGNAAGVTETLVDALLDRSGFCAALISVGWLRVREGSLEVPNFDRHLSESAKNRALTAQRVAKHKAKSGNEKVTVEALPEKRREEKSLDPKGSKKPPTPKRSAAEATAEAVNALELPEQLRTPEFQSAWCDFVKHRREIKKPLTPTQAEVAMRKLNGWGLAAAIEALENSVANGWQGIFPPGGKPAQRGFFDGINEFVHGGSNG